jgi:uncharacterized membrane protein (DUF106 family)
MFLPYNEIFLWALLISLIISVIYRVFTKPGEIRQLKKDMKFYREKSKEAQKSKDMKKMNEYSSEMLKLSQKQMKHNMKPMFITMGIILILLSFINSAYSGVVVETKQIDERTSLGHFSYAGFNHSIRAEKLNETDIRVVIDTNDNGDFSDEEGYLKDEVAYIENIHWGVQPQDTNHTSMGILIELPFTFPVLGWKHLNWLWWYILVTLPFTWIFRRFLGVE